MTKQKRVALYARVSTDAQTTENQLRQLRAVAKRQAGSSSPSTSITA